MILGPGVSRQFMFKTHNVPALVHILNLSLDSTYLPTTEIMDSQSVGFYSHSLFNVCSSGDTGTV